MSYRIPDFLTKFTQNAGQNDHALSFKVGPLLSIEKFDLLSRSMLIVVSVCFVGQLNAAEQQSKKGWELKPVIASETAPPPELDSEGQQPISAERSAQSETPESEVSQDTDLEASDSAPQISSQDTQPTTIPSAPVIDLSPELRDGLERQFQQMRKLLETEDAFSEALGEVYLSYGMLLQQAGRLEDSREMLVNALHITKVNYGVNSIEQRPVLRALFEMNFARQNTEELEDNLRRIIWLEKKVPELDDDFSFDMIVRLGNHFLELFLQNPRVTEYNLANLRKATRYFRLAVNNYSNRPLSVLFMPYGELAYSNFLRSRVETEVSRSYGDDTRQRALADLNRFPDSKKSRGSLGGAFATSQRYLQQYLEKATKENQPEHVVQALLSLGDLNILFGRRVGAMQYYERAWDASQALPVSHPIVASFEYPQLLPAFNFSKARPKIPANSVVVDGVTFTSVPLAFDIDTDGNVRRVQKDALDGTTGAMLSRAKRVARRMKFRPIIENGKLIRSVEHREDIRIKVRDKVSSASAHSS